MTNELRGSVVVFVDPTTGRMCRELKNASENAQVVYVETPWINRVPETMEDLAEDIASGYATTGHFGYRGGVPKTGKFKVTMQKFQLEREILNSEY